jgi:hypothetical protein
MYQGSGKILPFLPSVRSRPRSGGGGQFTMTTASHFITCFGMCARSNHRADMLGAMIMLLVAGESLPSIATRPRPCRAKAHNGLPSCSSASSLDKEDLAGKPFVGPAGRFTGICHATDDRQIILRPLSGVGRTFHAVLASYYAHSDRRMDRAII